MSKSYFSPLSRKKNAQLQEEKIKMGKIMMMVMMMCSGPRLIKTYKNNTHKIVQSVLMLEVDDVDHDNEDHHDRDDSDYHEGHDMLSSFVNH